MRDGREAVRDRARVRRRVGEETEVLRGGQTRPGPLPAGEPARQHLHSSRAPEPDVRPALDHRAEREPIDEVLLAAKGDELIALARDRGGFVAPIVRELKKMVRERLAVQMAAAPGPRARFARPREPLVGTPAKKMDDPAPSQRGHARIERARRQRTGRDAGAIEHSIERSERILKACEVERVDALRKPRAFHDLRVTRRLAEPQHLIRHFAGQREFRARDVKAVQRAERLRPLRPAFAAAAQFARPRKCALHLVGAVAAEHHRRAAAQNRQRQFTLPAQRLVFEHRQQREALVGLRDGFDIGRAIRGARRRAQPELDRLHVPARLGVVMRDELRLLPQRLGKMPGEHPRDALVVKLPLPLEQRLIRLLPNERVPK